MEKIKWTPSQKLAIERAGNTLVCAAAGSGKTAALTAKILHILSDAEQNVSLSDMLIVTYTKPAARELRERIGKKLAEAAPSDKRMIRCISDLPSADICTIHSFCLKILRENFAVMGLSPDFTVADEADAEVMKSRAMEDTIDDFFDGTYKMDDENCAPIAELCDAIGGTRDASSFDSELKRIYDSIRALGFDESELLKYADLLESAAGEDFLSTVWGKVVRDEITSASLHWSGVIDSLISEMSENEEVAKKYLPAAANLSDYLNRILKEAKNGSYASLKAAISNYVPVKLGRLLSKDKTDASENFRVMKDDAKKLFTKYANKFFALEPFQIDESERRTARILRGAAKVLSVYAGRFSDMKREKNVLDYGDLETLAFKLLVDENGSPTPAAREAGKRYKYIFIDEYQDTNRVQDGIFGAIGETSSRFIVGDIKQSIYRFRGAEPDVFTEYRNLWRETESGEEESETEKGDSRSIFMSENFRCSESVIGFANAVSRHMFSHGSIPFDDKDLLIFGSNSAVSEPVETCLIEKDDENPDENPEAAYAARRIAGMIGRDVYGNGIVKPSDVAILLRSANKSADDYIEALGKYGIPAKSISGTSFAGESEVMLAISILRTVDNPMRDVDLAGAMRSSIFSFSLDDLVKIRMKSSDGPLYCSVLETAGLSGRFDYDEEDPEEWSEDGSPPCVENNFPDDFSGSNGEDETNLLYHEIPATCEEDEILQKKCADFCLKIDRYREMERSMCSDDFIDWLYAETGILRAPEVTEKVNGVKNLRALLDMARRFESGTFGGLYGFLQHIQEKIDSGSLISEISGNDAVNIISIHKSKGLEFPICFLCETGKDRNVSDESANLLIDRELGVAMRLPDPGGLIRCGTPVRGAISEKLRLAGTMEETRVLYVAMTRARDKLIVTAKVRDAEAKLETIRRDARFADKYTVNSTTKLIDYILTAAVLSDEKICEIITPLTADEAEQIAPVAKNEEARIDDPKIEIYEEIKEAANRFDFEYPYEFLSALPSKLTVSKLYPEILDDDAGELLQLGDTDDTNERNEKTAPPEPKFMSGSTDYTPAARGTSTHVFMQFADFDNLYENGARSELGRLLDKKFITEEMASLVILPQIERFRESVVFDRIRNARMIKREFRFNVLLPAENFTSNENLAKKLRENGAKVTVQGVFDCVFEDEDGSLVLLDYKTDSVSSYELSHPEAAFKKLRDRHELQMKYYAEACGKLFGRAPDEIYIYSLPLGRCVDMARVMERF